MTTLAPPSTTPPTVTHNSATCTLGPDGGKCEMCWWAEYEQRQVRQSSESQCYWCKHPDHGNKICPVPHLAIGNHGLSGSYPCGCTLSSPTIVEQSAAAIRARRTALLERADIHSPTEGAIALADAHLQAESWWQRLPNNAMQDAAVLELAGEIENAIESWLQRRRDE